MNDCFVYWNLFCDFFDNFLFNNLLFNWGYWDILFTNIKVLSF